MWRYLPSVVLANIVVLVLPGVVAWSLLPGHGLWLLAAVLVATGLSMAVAHLLARLWARLFSSCDLTFADLLLWGWIQRAIIQRRIRSAAGLLETHEAAAPLTQQQRINALERLSSVLGARDAGTLGHSRRVARHAENIAREMRLAPEQVAKVRIAAAVHDVGKINTPSKILNKAYGLTDEEFEIVKRHADDGAAMVSVLDDEEITAMVRLHHERLDGSGYPYGLHRMDIPIGARIVAVADTFDAMTSSRPYRRAMKHRAALAVLHKDAGTRLDPDAVRAFASCYSARRVVPKLAVITALPARAVASVFSPSAAGTVGALAIQPLALGALGLGLGGAVGGGAADLKAATTQTRPVATSTQRRAEPAEGTNSPPATPTTLRGRKLRSRRPLVRQPIKRVRSCSSRRRSTTQVLSQPRLYRLLR